MSKLKRTSAKGAFFALAVWLTGLCMSAPAYSAVCFLPDDTGNCGTGDMNIVPDEPKKGVCDGKTTYTPEVYNEKFDDNCYTYTVGEKNGKTVYCDITKTDTKGYVLDAQDHCCQSGTAWDNKAQECCTGGKCPITCPDPQELYIIKNDICVCAYGKVNGDCCPVNTFPSNGICCPYGQEGKADGSSLICCPEDQVNKGGTCVDKVPVQTCSQMSTDYKASCPTDYTKKAAKDEKGNLVKDSNGNQCYTCVPKGKNPLTVRLRLTCDGQTCPDEIYDGDYTFYYIGNNGNLNSQPANRDPKNKQDVISIIPDWKTSDFLTKWEGHEDYYRITPYFRGILKPTKYTPTYKPEGRNGDIVTSLDKKYSILEANDNDINIDKDKSGAQEAIISLDLTTKGEQSTPTYHIFAKVKCPGPYKEIKACKAAEYGTWGYSETDDICPYRLTDVSTGETSDYFTGSRYDNSYAKNAAGCANFRLLIDGKEAAKYWHYQLYNSVVTNLDSLVSIGNTGFMPPYITAYALKNVIDVSKLSDDEVLIELLYQPEKDYFKKYNGTSFSLEVIPVTTDKNVAQPDKAGKSGFEYAFANNYGKMAVGNQTIPLKLTDKNALYTYVGNISTIHPVIRLQAVVDTIKPKQLTSGGSKLNTPYAYKTYRKLWNPINGGINFGDISYQHWVNQNGEVCSANALNVYVTASRNVLSRIETSLQDFGINADVVMEKGDIITYPEYGPWCMNLHPSYTYCYNYCECDSKNDYNTGCGSCVKNCEAGNLNSGVTSFLAKYAKTDGAGNYTTYNQRQISSGPTQSGYVYNDGAIYIIGSGFNTSEDGTTGSNSESDYETCYNKTCEDFGLNSNSQPGMICKTASKCNLKCLKCAYVGCVSDYKYAECSTDIADQYDKFSNSSTFCTEPSDDMKGITTTCEQLAKNNSNVKNDLLDTDVISDLSKFVEVFTKPDDVTSTDTRRCAVCVYTSN